MTLDQRERVTSVGPYVRAELELGSRFRLSLGARADYAKFRVDDAVAAVKARLLYCLVERGRSDPIC